MLQAIGQNLVSALGEELIDSLWKQQVELSR